MTDTSSLTASAEKVQYGVYLGPWVNWSRGGRILGATLTLEPRYGLLLLAFTATFVGFVASRFWRLIALLLHRIYSTPEPRDALHHQRQVVLRNSVSAASTLWISVQLAWCWRAIANDYLARTLPTIVFAASVFCAFTTAGGFTSWISSGIGNDVLIDASQCGTMNDSAKSIDAFSTTYPWVSQTVNNAANYAQQCYSVNATGTLDCTTFVKDRLPFRSVLNASCPFNDTICRSNESNLLLDSGLISSDDLGRNMPVSQRMFYREVLQCAPLRTDGFVSNVSTKQDNYTRYWYGNYVGSTPKNWTYEVEDLDAQYLRQSDNPMQPGMTAPGLFPLDSAIANGTWWYIGSNFVPIPQLSVSDADLLLVFLSGNGVAFLNRTDDPWYHSIMPGKVLFDESGNRTLYLPDEAASPLGCVQRYQYCNSSKKCGSLTSFVDALITALPLFHQTPSELWVGWGPYDKLDGISSRFGMFQSTLQSAPDLYTLIITLGSSSLLSRQHLAQGLMGPLPDNQWQLDVSNWFAMRMASLQAAFVNNAHGPNDEALLPYINRPVNKYQRTMCNNQKILSTDYTSLSLFGLYFTYVTGSAVVLASYIAEPLFSLFYSRRKYKEYKYLEWTANSTLQLQRLAYQGLGSEKWSNYTDDVPKTRPGYFLADLARAYPPKGDDDEVQEVKPRPHAASTATPSVAGASANPRVSEQSRDVPSRPVSAVSGLVPQAASPQPVSPISSSQPPEA